MDATGQDAFVKGRGKSFLNKGVKGKTLWKGVPALWMVKTNLQKKRKTGN